MGLFNSDLIKKTVKNVQERGGYKAKLPIVPAGKQVLTLSNVEHKDSKKDGMPMVIIQMTLSDEYRPVSAAFKMDGNGSEIAKERFVEFLFKGYKYTLQECNDINDVINQVKQFLGQDLQVAVRHRQSLYSFTDRDGIDRMKVVDQPEFWYCGAIDDDSFSVKPDRLIRELTDDEKDKLLKFEELNGSVVTEKKAEDHDNSPTDSEDEEDNLPF